MIACSRLGKMGQLGNQMFQYAMLVELQERKGYEIAIPLRFHAPKRRGQVELYAFRFSAAALPAIFAAQIPRVFEERRRPFDPRTFDVADGTDLIGYFQSVRYLQRSAARIRREFTFVAQIQRQAREVLCDVAARAMGRPLCGIHVRRGDYIREIAEHPGSRVVLTCRDIATLKSVFFNRDVEPLYVVASDDMAWCRRNLSDEHYFLKDTSHFVDICVLSRCDHMILSCSSFSWWAAFLHDEPQRMRVCPALWLPDRKVMSNHICPPHWHSVDLGIP